MDPNTRRGPIPLPVEESREVAESLRELIALVDLKYGNLDSGVNEIVDRARRVLAKVKGK